MEHGYNELPSYLYVTTVERLLSELYPNLCKLRLLRIFYHYSKYWLIRVNIHRKFRLLGEVGNASKFMMWTYGRTRIRRTPSGSKS